MQRDMAICVLIMRLQVIISVLSRRECDKRKTLDNLLAHYSSISHFERSKWSNDV